MMTPYKAVGRNDPCPCGSGRKFKKCCLESQRLNEPTPGLHRSGRPARDIAGSALEQAEAAVREYDPLTEPSPEHWLALDEQERIDLVVDYHRRARTGPAARETLHAVVHVIVENQIADAGLPVRRTAQRLMSEGLDRHQAVHAIGSVLAGHINALAREVRSAAHSPGTTSDRDANEDYFTELEALTAGAWLRSG